MEDKSQTDTILQPPLSSPSAKRNSELEVPVETTVIGKLLLINLYLKIKEQSMHVYSEANPTILNLVYSQISVYRVQLLSRVCYILHRERLVEPSISSGVFLYNAFIILAGQLIVLLSFLSYWVQWMKLVWTPLLQTSVFALEVQNGFARAILIFLNSFLNLLFSINIPCTSIIFLGFGNRCGKPRGPREPPSEWTWCKNKWTIIKLYWNIQVPLNSICNIPLLYVGD